VHPDVVGGADEAIYEINGAYEKLQIML